MSKTMPVTHICDETCRINQSDILIRCVKDNKNSEIGNPYIRSYNDSRNGNTKYLSTMVWKLSDADLKGNPVGLSVKVERLLPQSIKNWENLTEDDKKSSPCKFIPNCQGSVFLNVSSKIDNFLSKVFHTPSNLKQVEFPKNPTFAHATINCTGLDDIERAKLQTLLYNHHQWYIKINDVDLHFRKDIHVA